MSFDFIKNEHEILKLWRDRDVFSKMSAKNKNSKDIYRTLDGPITANNAMCVHHCWGRTLKDAIIKYNTLRGRKTHFQNGFDAQGMWVEVEVEKDLGLGGKHAIAGYGLEKFTEKCIERVNRFSQIQTAQSVRLGQIMDWDNSYYTNSDHNIECIWNFLKVCYDRKMLAKSYKAMPWCPRCGTSLSEHEMNGSYKELSHKAVFIKAKLGTDIAKRIGPGVTLVVWTTTPWTLSANVAIAINPDHDYVLLEVGGEKIIVGKAAIKVMEYKGAPRYKVIDEFKGAKLVGLKYEPFLPLKVQNFEHKIVPWDAVSATDGSGAVHIAPGCGAEDFELGQKLNLKQIIPVDEAGVFTSDFEFLAGKNTANCEEIVFDKLQKNGSLLYNHDHSHSYPYCWRCKTNVIFRLVEGWDIATDGIRKELLASAKKVEWVPAFTGKAMEDWLTNMGDWNISRRRFYGLPLPIYQHEAGHACGHITVVGSRAELRKLAVKPELVDKLPHLHRPYIDEIEIKCPHCGKPMKRIPDVGDCWLDAGIAPFSTTAKDYTPFDVVIEMKEQIRLWFYSQLFMSVVLTGKAPYKKVIGYGRILDERGGMFSKSGPNNIKFDDAAETFGVDAMRYLFVSCNPASDVRFGPTLIEETRRKLLGIYNAFVFYDTYAQIDRPDVHNHTPRDLDVTDAWLITATNELIANTQRAYEDHKPHEVIQFAEAFIEDLTNFYIRVNRRRFWKNQSDTDKHNAYWALYSAIRATAIVLCPITPFLCEHIWQKIRGPKNAELVMLADWPDSSYSKYNGKIPKDISEQVRFVRNVISVALSLRARENLKLRQPLSTLYIQTNNTAAVKQFESIICAEVNVHKIEIAHDDTKFNTPYLAVNFKSAGAVLKSEAQKLKVALETSEPVIKNDKVSVGEFKNLPMNLFERKFKSKPEYVSVTEDGLTLTIDTVLTDELVEEGILREIIRTIQVARQEADLEITARVHLSLVTKNNKFRTLVEKNYIKISEEVLASTLSLSEIPNTKNKKINIDGDDIVIGLKVSK
ncbi:MAG: isoleucine--tRNA ligase [Christensenellaceae bacterium]|jgi:isoleucyl-tRNA synthetase|nr:isoleucine--tRNA ligase [Christensenellaceae bacterium]